MSRRGEAEHCRPPCTVSNNQACQIHNWLPMCNELLFHIGIQLREERCGSLSLVCSKHQRFQFAPSNGDLYRATLFLRWLLRTHVCVTSLLLVNVPTRMEGYIIYGGTCEISRLKKFTVRLCYGDDPLLFHITKLLPRLSCLEELDCSIISDSIDAFIASVSELLRTTTCLSSLLFRVGFEFSQTPTVFIDALATNTTLKAISLFAHWDNAEMQGEFWEYVRSNRLLTRLDLSGSAPYSEDPLIEQSLVCNTTLSTLRIDNVCGGEITARFLTRIFALYAGLKDLYIGMRQANNTDLTQDTLTRCAEAMAENETIEQLELPYSLWQPTNWTYFLEFLQRNRHLKTLQITRHWVIDNDEFKSVLEALERTESWARVSFGNCVTQSEGELIHFRSFSSIYIGGPMNQLLEVLQRLPNLRHFTSVTVFVHENRETFFYLAKYIRETTALRTLRLRAMGEQGPDPTESLSLWETVFESIGMNSSIAVLEFSIDGIFHHNHLLVNAVMVSNCIRRATFALPGRENSTDLAGLLSESIGENYNLLDVKLRNHNVDTESRRYVFKIQDTTRRNSGFVEGATVFKETTPLDWYSANALEKVSRYPALLTELAERESMAKEEVRRMLRSRLMSVEGLHDFMKLTGVVKELVRCQKPVEGCGKQLIELEGDCWCHIRQYLSFDDVKRFTATNLDESVPWWDLPHFDSLIGPCFTALIRVRTYFTSNRVRNRLRLLFGGVFS